MVDLWRATLPHDAAALLDFDKRIFGSDTFESAEVWQRYKSYWIAADDQRVGAIAIAPDAAPSAHAWEEELHQAGALFLASIGILPEFQGKSYGSQALRLLIRRQCGMGFGYLISNFRVSNEGSRHLHERAGFTDQKRIIPGYYRNPVEDAMVVLRYF